MGVGANGTVWVVAMLQQQRGAVTRQVRWGEDETEPPPVEHFRGRGRRHTLFDWIFGRREREDKGGIEVDVTAVGPKFPWLSLPFGSRLNPQPPRSSVPSSKKYLFGELLCLLACSLAFCWELQAQRLGPWLP